MGWSRIWALRTEVSCRHLFPGFLFCRGGAIIPLQYDFNFVYNAPSNPNLTVHEIRSGIRLLTATGLSPG